MLARTLVSFLVVGALIDAREIPSPPRIIKQPPTDEVLFQVGINENDKPFYIECEAVGEPAPKYRWVKNGKTFDWQAYDDRISQQPGRGTLSIAKPQDEDLGQYQCFAENEYGVATSNSVFMRKAELNPFKNSLPLPVVGYEGDPFKLTCQPPDGWPKPKVYWVIQFTSDGFKTINNSRMTLDPEGNLWFSNLTREDASDDFIYACAAASSTKLEYKLGNRVILNVQPSGSGSSLNKHEPVYQYATRKNEVAYRGKVVELFCIYGGTPLPQTVWKKDGKQILYSERVTQNNYGKSLIIKLVDFEDEGQYTCDVSNGVGVAQSYSINLKVYAVPFFTEEPEIINAAEDETVQFRCSASGVPEPQIKWIHNGKPISEASPNPRRKVNTNNIIIERLTKTDTGNYGCNATNSLGYVYKDVYVNVLALAPEITEAPRDQDAVDGKTINMTCKVFGAPKPEVKWVHNGKELTGGRYKVLENGDLNIESVQFDDNGQYTCYAENKFGRANASAMFTVRAHTYISDGPEDYEVAAGTQATFRCNAVQDPSLPLEIIWLNNGQEIDFGAEPRFVKTSDYSLTITKTIELDSATYTCIARTPLDETQAQATLTVQDVPNAPTMKNSIICKKKDATIQWMPMGDNRAPILHYTLQYNTSFTPDTWVNAYDFIPAADTTYNVPMSPWANYTFRVIAWNKIGSSNPSAHSEVCTTQQEVPHKNPDRVEGEGNKPDNLVIRWTAMPEIEHNAPKFQYKVFWRRDIPGTDYVVNDILDWRQDKLVINEQPSFQRYKIKVVAMNELGEADVSPEEVIGYSGENEPTQAPQNFTLLQIQSPTTALLSWNPVPLESVQGHFIGYKIKTWTENKLGHKEIQVQGEATKALVTNFVPFSKNYAQVYVHNGKYHGPPSETLSFDTPEGVPGQMSSLEAYQMGSSAFLLSWKKPDQPNGILTGYKIYYAVVNGTAVGNEIARTPQINNPNQLRAKLSGLQPNVKYRLYISATTSAGESKKYFIERVTRGVNAVRPAIPNFTWAGQPVKGNLASIRVNWIPDLERPGSHFFVKYCKKGETNCESTAPEMNEDYLTVAGLQPGELYEFTVVAVDGNYVAESQAQDVDTYGVEGPIIQPRENVATAGWFIGMMVAIAFLLFVLIIVCIVKRNRGGKYAVHEREQANGRQDYPDDGGFHEYSQPLDGKSTASEPKQGPESDTDSMAEYGEGDTGRFTEDGSFIGQYVPTNMRQAPPNVATYV
ncbi:PREDICTED: neuroglian isoform X2 [Nicrophorus vespilloides]|uniref:Neuroglian isoform X2 n=1 Tax=Nicrophorus vespilloides TaxID=110193 RepID=A0ABM1N7K9_NICVS|nr:PREDICTED: neuroglian isoform X2 [Nicrophorus vespilloides]